MCKDPSVKVFHAVSEDDGSTEELTELVGFTEGADARLLNRACRACRASLLTDHELILKTLHTMKSLRVRLGGFRYPERVDSEDVGQEVNEAAVAAVAPPPSGNLLTHEGSL